MLVKSWMERLWANMNAMPGPVWVFGAWNLYRFVPWFAGIILAPGLFLNNGGWGVIGITLLALAGHLLALAVVWSLIYKKPYALSFTMWYAGLKVGALLYAWLSNFSVAGGVWLTLILHVAMWIAFAYYMDRSEAIERLFPRESRRNIPWWMAILMVVVVGAMNL